MFASGSFRRESFKPESWSGLRSGIGIIDIGFGEWPAEKSASAPRGHRGSGRTTLEHTIGFGSGRVRRRSVPGFLPLPLIVIGDGAGLRRVRGLGSTAVATCDLHGHGRRRRTGTGTLALVLLRATDRDALLALAAHAVD